MRFISIIFAYNHNFTQNSSPVRFAFLIFKVFPFGGVQRDMLRIAQDCVKNGHQVTIYTGEWRGDKPVPEMQVKILASHGWQNHQKHQALITAMHTELRHDNPDFIMGFNRMPALDAYFVADPCFIERAWHRGWWHKLSGRYQFFKAMENAVFAHEVNCQLLILNPNDIALYQKWYNTPISRFHSLPPNIPADRFFNTNREVARARLRQMFDLPADAYVILMVGSAFVRKGLDRVIKSLANLPHVLQTNTWLLAVGEDKPDAMRKLAKDYGVSRQVIIENGRNDIPLLMNGADLLAHLARTELAGLVIIEALTAGLPVLVTEVCGYAMHVEKAEAGIVLSTPFNQQACDTALATMLTTNRKVLWQSNAERYTQSIAASKSSTPEADLIAKFALHKMQHAA